MAVTSRCMRTVRSICGVAVRGRGCSKPTPGCCRGRGARTSARGRCVASDGERTVYDAVDGATPCCAVKVREFRRWRIDPV